MSVTSVLKDPRENTKKKKLSEVDRLLPEKETHNVKTLRSAIWQRLASFGEYIERDGIKWIVGSLTPELAILLLRNRPDKQRKIRESHVNELARDLKEGRYYVGKDPIDLNADTFELDNGQHRCVAVIKTGIPIPIQLFTVDDDPKNIFGRDIGIIRNVNDFEAFFGLPKTPKALEGGIVFEHQGFTISKKFRGKISNAERFDIIQNLKPSFRDKLLELTYLKATAGVIAAAIACMRIDEEEAFLFFKNALQNTHTMHGQEVSPLRLLSTWILTSRRDKAKNKTGERYKREAAYRALRAWNAYRQRKELKMLRYDTAFDVPTPV